MAVRDTQTFSDSVLTAQARLLHTRKIAYAAEVWSLAQVKSSVLKSRGVDRVAITDSYTLFTRRSKREWARKDPGVQQTQYQNLEYERRALFTQDYTTAAVNDQSDTNESGRKDWWNDVKTEDAHGAARLCDRVILFTMATKVALEGAPMKDGQFGPLADLLSDSATRNPEHVRTGTSAFNERVPDLAFCEGLPDTTETTDSQLITSPIGDWLEKVLYVFSKREIDELEGLICAATPELMAILRTDSDFKNAENVYSSRQGNSLPSNFIMYKGISFLPVKESVLPAINGGEINCNAKGGAGADANDIDSSKLKLSCRALEFNQTKAQVEGRLYPFSFRAGANNGQAQVSLPTEADTNAGGGDRALVECSKNHIAYFWYPKAIKFGSRAANNFSAQGQLEQYQFAKVQYMRMNMGTVLMDEDYAMIVPFRGKREAKFTAGGPVS